MPTPGRTKFLSVGCNGCHGNAGANATFAVGNNRNFNTGVEASRNAALANFPHDGGFGTTAQLDGSFGDGTFNTPPLIEAADTGPFFHTATTISGASAHNTPVATTIEEAVAFYNSPAFRGGPFVMTPTEIDNIGRFLRGLNAAFNIAIASRRIEAVGALLDSDPFPTPMEDTLKQLAVAEVQDAVRVLSEVPNLNVDAQGSLNHFIQLATNTSGGKTTTSTTDSGPSSQLDRMRLDLATAAAALGTNLTMQIGDGVLMF